MNSSFADELRKLFLFFKSYKNLSLMISDVYNPFFFVLIISAYRLIIFAAFSGSCTSAASLFKSSNSKFLSTIIESSNRFFISSFYMRFVFLLSAKPFHIYKQKNNHFSTKSKTKMFIQANFFVSLEAKNYLICSHLFFFTFFF